MHVSGSTVTLVAVGIVLSGCGGRNPASPGEMAGPTSPPLSRLEIFPIQLATKIGETIEPRITARDMTGAEVSVTPQYSSSNPAALFVDGGGAIHARGVGTVTLRATAGGQSAEMLVHVGLDTFDPAAPSSRVLTVNYIDLSKIARISRFRSTVGHTYGQEPCRSMKHYYQPRTSLDWTTVDIYAPAAGTIWLIATDGWGYRLMFRPRDLAAIDVVMFHVNPDPGIVPRYVGRGGGAHRPPRDELHDVGYRDPVRFLRHRYALLVFRIHDRRALLAVPGARRIVPPGRDHHESRARRGPDRVRARRRAVHAARHAAGLAGSQLEATKSRERLASMCEMGPTDS